MDVIGSRNLLNRWFHEQTVALIRLMEGIEHGDFFNPCIDDGCGRGPAAGPISRAVSLPLQSSLFALANLARVLPLSGILIAAVYTDLRSHRIPNNLIVLGLFMAIIFQLVANGAHGLLSGSLAALIGLGCFMPFYALRAMGAGDVKLMAVVGLFTSPRGVLYAVALSLLAGGVCALGYLVWRAARAYTGSIVQQGIAGGASAGTVAAFVAARLARRDRLPYALPIAVGSVTACLIQGFSVEELAAWL